MRLRQEAPAWVAVPLAATFLWLLLGIRLAAIVFVGVLVLVSIGVVWPLERDERIVRWRR